MFDPDRAKELLTAFQEIGLRDVLTLESAGLVATLLDNHYDAVAILSKDPKMLYVNKNFEKTVGLKREVVVGRHVKELVEKKIFQAGPSLGALRHKKPYTTVHRLDHGRDILITANPILDENNEVLFIVDNIRDITDLQHLKEKSLKYQLKTSIYEKEMAELRARSSFQEYLVAKSGAMRLVAERAIRAAAVDANVLLTGESGVGKGLLASYIHRHGSRSKGPYIQVNCSAIPESLFESELFGYEEGAFTGARKKGKPGLLEVAHNGTMLLDEVGDMPWSIQAKLLNFLQEGRFFRVGGTKTVDVDVRIISATNADLQKRINEKLFREDLYYRLNVLPIHIPPLRERRDDIVPLALTFLNEYNKKYGQEKTLTLEAQKALYAYDWPGNVRELQNVLERIVILTEEKQIYSKHVYLAIGCTPTSAANSIQVNSLVPLPNAYQEVDRQLLQMALEQTRSMRKIAAMLGISHPTVSKKIKQVFPEIGQPVSS